MKNTQQRLVHTARIVGSLGIAAICFACMTIRTSPRFAGYMAPSDSVNLRSLRLALVPTAIPPDFENPQPIALRFDSLIQQNLTDHGFDVVPSTAYRDIWSRLNTEAGGFFDPYTGERDEPKYQAGVKQLIKEMHERYAPDAFVYPEVWVVEAPLFSDVARWDGISHRVWPAPSNLGAVYATTLAVVIEDSSGTELFANGRGLEVIEEYDLNTNEMVMLPRNEIFQDDALYLEAVTVVLTPLLTTPPRR